MTEHAAEVSRLIAPHGPQRCCCGHWEPTLPKMKEHIAQLKAKAQPLAPSRHTLRFQIARMERAA